MSGSEETFEEEEEEEMAEVSLSESPESSDSLPSESSPPHLMEDFLSPSKVGGEGGGGGRGGMSHSLSTPPSTPSREKETLRGMKDGWYGEKLMDPFPALSSSRSSSINFPDWRGFLCSCLPPSWRRFMTITALLICLAVNGGLRSLIPAGFKAIQQEFQLSSGQLGVIPFTRNLAAALVLPFGSVLCDMFSRRLILVYSFVYLGALTIVLGLVESYLSFLLIRTISGIAFDLIIPIAASYVGDYFRRDKRGLAFGSQGISAALGSIVGAVLMGTFASTTIAGQEGWRVICVLWGLACVFIAILAILCVFEPVRGQTELEEPSEEKEEIEVDTEENESFLLFEWQALRHIFYTEEVVEDEEGNAKEESKLNYSWFVLVCSQVFHTIPWVGFAFLILWYQYNGLSDFEASMSYAVAGLGFMLGCFASGVISDKISRIQSKWGRDYGRILLAQGSLLVVIPCLVILIEILGDLGSAIAVLIMSSFIGFFAAFSEQACDNPLMTEIVHPKLRSSSIGFVYAIGGAGSSIGSLLVGYVAEVFGYEAPKEDVEIQDLPQEVRDRNATALGNAFLTVSCTFWGLQFLTYFFLYFAYPPRRNFIHFLLKNEEREREEREEGGGEKGEDGGDL